MSYYLESCYTEPIDLYEKILSDLIGEDASKEMLEYLKYPSIKEFYNSIIGTNIHSAFKESNLCWWVEDRNYNDNIKLDQFGNKIKNEVVSIMYDNEFKSHNSIDMFSDANFVELDKSVAEKNGTETETEITYRTTNGDNNYWTGVMNRFEKLISAREKQDLEFSRMCK